MSITVNLTKAKEIAKDNLRAEREPVLAALDVQFMRAVESGNTELQTSIATQKQALRDITADESITGATDVNGLKTAMNNLIEQIKS
jgi:transposase